MCSFSANLDISNIILFTPLGWLESGARIRLVIRVMCREQESVSRVSRVVCLVVKRVSIQNSVLAKIVIERVNKDQKSTQK